MQLMEAQELNHMVCYPNPEEGEKSENERDTNDETDIVAGVSTSTVLEGIANVQELEVLRN